MAISKKDYEAIAQRLSEQRENGTNIRTREDQVCATTINAVLDIVSHSLADYCARDNPCFDRAKFLSACGVRS